MKKLQSINPYNNELIQEYDVLTDQGLNEKINLSEEEFESWKSTTLQEKSSFLLNASEYLLENRSRFAELITSEMGKPITEAEGEIEKCAWVCRYYAHHSEEHLQEELIETEASRSLIRYEPLGPVLAVMPWNFPFWQVFRFAAPAIMAGNTCLLKHASNVSQCSMAIEQTFRESGFPEGVFQSLLIEASQVEDVIKHSAVKAVTLTGSEQAGSIVASLAGKYIKKSVMELGGSDPFIVLNDAHIDLAIEKAMSSRFINSGQSCIAAKRFIVQEGVYKEFKSGIIERINSLQVGDPKERSTKLGPMARPDLASALWSQVSRSIEAGASSLLSGNRPEDNSSHFQPVVLENVKPGMPAFDEELFGPVFCLTKVETETDAIEMANNSVFGLGASIWTANEDKGYELAKKINAGCVFVNEIVKSDPRLPFGGIKQSGYGRELSALGIREFVNAKTVWIN